MTRALAACAALLTALCLCATAPAQPNRATDARSGVSAEIAWGFDGHIAPYTWAPIRITLTGGERAAQCLVILEVDRAPSGSVRVVAPAALTPGRETRIDLLVPLDWWISQAELTVQDDRGRTLLRETGEVWSSSALRIPQPMDYGARLVVSVGAASLAQASVTWSDGGHARTPIPAQPGVPALAARTVVASMGPGALPPIAQAYDGVAAVVIAGGAMQEATGPVVEAVRSWVRQGGCLVIVADRPGNAHDRWLPQGVLTLSPAEVAANGRTIRRPSLTAHASALGWRTHEDEALGAWRADGPDGLGWITVLGADPAPASMDADERSVAWAGALDDILPAGPADHTANPRQDAVLDILAGELTNVRPPPIWPVVLAMAALAALLGPIDWFVLKRRAALHRSWITALGWITLASIVGYAAPLAFRSLESQSRRIAVLDVGPGQGAARITGVTGVIANSSRLAQVSGPDTAWWQPVRAGWSGNAGAGVLTLEQFPGSPGGTVREIGLGMWSFQTYRDDGEAPAAITASVRTDGDAALSAQVAGLQEDASIVRASLWTKDGWRDAEGIETNALGRVTLRFAGDIAAESTWDDTGLPAGVRRANTSDFIPSLVLSQRAVGARTGFMQRRIERGGWGVVLLEVESASSDVRFLGVHNARQRTFIRAMVPLNDAPMEPTP